MSGRSKIWTGWMTKRYVLALTVIALLAFSAYGAFLTLVADQTAAGNVVNVANDQRMLSQRAGLMVSAMVRTRNTQRYAELSAGLIAVTNQLEETRAVLTRSAEEAHAKGELSETLHGLYFSTQDPVDNQLRNYVSALRRIQTTPRWELSPNTPDVRYIQWVGTGSLLNALDRMVTEYEKRQKEIFSLLHRLEGYVLTFTLLTLALEALFIFSPMVRQTQAQITKISEISDQLREARDLLEEKVKLRTEELAQAKEAAEQANKAKSKFLAAAGHDLLQPLDAIGMFTGMLSRQIDSPRAKALFEDLRNAQRSMRVLLRSILDLSKLEAGIVEPKKERTALAPLLQQIANEYMPLAAQKGLLLRIVPSSVQVETDPHLLERILRNFVSNAIRYTKKGEVLIGCRRKGKKIELQVHDTGPGIAKENLKQIFEEFLQLDDPDRDKSEGIGLGLAIVDRLAKLLDHPLGVRSQTGVGTAFSIELPTSG